MNASRTVLIVGGSGSVGAGLARQCAAAGNWPLVSYARHGDLAQRVVEQCGCGEALRLDLTECDRCNLAALRPVDAVAFAAGLFVPGRGLLSASDADLRRLIDVNMLAPIRLIRALLPAGHPLRDVIVVLSTASFGRASGPYALSKIGELGVCKLLVDELAERGMRLNAVAPGWIDTPMAELAATASGRTLDTVRADHLEARLLSADEIGALCIALLADPNPLASGRLAVWDRRQAREPIWLTLDAIFAVDALAWTRLPAVSQREQNPACGVAKTIPGETACPGR